MATTIYLTNTASDIVIGGVECLLADVGVRGAGLSTATTNTAAGTTAVPMTRTAGGTPIEFYTAPLDAVTIAATLTSNLWMSESDMNANVDARIEIYRVTNAGGSPTALGNNFKGTEIPVTTRAAQNWTKVPTSTALTAGQRLRFVPYGGASLTQGAGFTFNLGWGATSAAADGDSWVQFTETITEQGGAAADDFAPYVGGSYYP